MVLLAFQLSVGSTSRLLIHELRAEDHRSLACLSVVNPGWLPILSVAGLEFTPYCAQRVKRQFGLDHDVPASLREATPPLPSLAPFIKSRAFAYWEGKVNRIMIPSAIDLVLTPCL